MSTNVRRVSSVLSCPLAILLLTVSCTMDSPVEVASETGSLVPRDLARSVSPSQGPVVISNLRVGTGRPYVVVTGGMGVGVRAYIDDAFLYHSVPDALRGQTYIQTANADRTVSGVYRMVQFRVDRESEVYVAYNSHAHFPGWLRTNEYVNTGQTLVVNAEGQLRNYTLWMRTYGPGEDIIMSSPRPGDNNAHMYTVIVRPAGGDPGLVPHVSAAHSHTCTLRSSGIVNCWGDNAFGRAPPEKQAKVGLFVKVSAHKEHTCALRGDGVIECWGTTQYNRAPAERRSSVGTFIDVGAGQHHTCGLRSDGVAECWGGNGYGQAPPVRSAATGRRFIALAIGDDHSCALRDDGAAECWGQLGNGTTRRATVGHFTQLASGDDHTCAVRNDGVIECWFLNPHGQAPPEKRAASGHFVQVNGEGWHTCALRNDGVVECWGMNGWGQAPAEKRAQRGRYIQVGGGYSYTCAVRNDEVVECWGYNGSGQAMSEQRIYFTSTPPTPALVGQTYRVTAVGGGSGSPIVFGTLTPGTCTVSGSTVSFVAPGTCTISADQAGNARHFPAPRETQNVTVGMSVSSTL